MNFFQINNSYYCSLHQQSLHSGSSCEGMHYNKPSEINASRNKHKKISSALLASPQDHQVLHLVKDVKVNEDDECEQKNFNRFNAITLVVMTVADVVELHERPTMDSEESEISALERRIEDFTSSDEDEHWSAPQQELSEGCYLICYLLINLVALRASTFKQERPECSHQKPRNTISTPGTLGDRSRNLSTALPLVQSKHLYINFMWEKCGLLK